MKISAITYFKKQLSSVKYFFVSLDKNKICTTFFIFLMLFFIENCGRVGDPIAPRAYSLESTKLLEVIQRGEKIFLRWPYPNFLPGTNNLSASQVEIYRFEEPINSPIFMKEEIYLEQAQLISSIDFKIRESTETSLITFEDSARNINSTSVRVRYAVRYVYPHSQFGPLSNFAFVKPSLQLAEAPTNIQGIVEQDAITLQWKTPKQTLDENEITIAPTFNVYRRAINGKFSNQPLNEIPLSEPNFLDTKFQFNSTYIYIVRSVTSIRGNAVESEDSESVTISPIDTFAPASPQNLTGASAAGIISLFWPTNSEKDLKGYKIYRAEKDNQSDWICITQEPLSTTTYQDKTGQIKKIYLYKITAIDIFNNESSKSEAIEVEVFE